MSDQSTTRAPGSVSQRLRRLVRGAEPSSANADGGARLDTRLARIERALDDLVEAARTPPGEQPKPQGLDAIAEGLAALEKQISRAGREQLKTNTLVEAQLEQQRAALALAHAAGERHERDTTTLREHLRTTQQAARLELVRALLPVLDGLDEALRSGTYVLEHAATPRRRPGLFGGLRRHTHPTTDEQALRESMRAWLDGLRFVRQRLLDVLAAEGVRPMDAEGQPFEPHQHTALEVVPAKDRPPGTVVSILRQGYLAGGRILRHAEVAVAGDTGQQDPPHGNQKAT